MSAGEQPTDEHQVGITNAQEVNPDAEISLLTREMNALFAAKQYAAAAHKAVAITALSRNELKQTFERHGVKIVHLDHEAFGIYHGMIEPSYDLRVEGSTAAVLQAATEFGKRHAQEAVLIARKVGESEADPAERLGLVIALRAAMSVQEAVLIVEVVKTCGFKGATFLPKRQAEVSIYQTDDLGMTREQFEKAAERLVALLQQTYTQALHQMQAYIVLMPKP
jgi:hypothetical protein